jgi:hypothetical protein
MKLQDIVIVFMCPDHNEKYNSRRLHMESLLQRIGCKHIIHYKSGTENYPMCLNNATVAILESHMDTPVMILEDDVEFTGADAFDFIPEADAIYFGLSRSGGHPTENKDEGECLVIPYSDSHVRVLNMLGGHAILYISSAYKRAVIDLFNQHKDIEYYNDVLLSRLQPNFLVLANKKPSFYQSSKFNTGMHEETWTNIEFS